MERKKKGPRWDGEARTRCRKLKHSLRKTKYHLHSLRGRAEERPAGDRGPVPREEDPAPCLPSSGKRAGDRFLLEEEGRRRAPAEHTDPPAEALRRRFCMTPAEAEDLRIKGVQGAPRRFCAVGPRAESADVAAVGVQRRDRLLSRAHGYGDGAQETRRARGARVADGQRLQRHVRGRTLFSLVYLS